MRESRKARREIRAMRDHVRNVRGIYPTTAPMVRPVGLASDARNGRKDAGR